MCRSSRTGQWHFALCLYKDAAYDWREDEIELARELTTRVWTRLERLRAEAALRESEARFRAAVDTVSSLIWTNNADGLMEGEQPGWGNFTGQTQAEYQAYGWSKAVHPEDAQPTLDAWTQAVAEKRLFEFDHRIRRRDGEWRLCSIRAVPLLGGDGNVREWVGVHTDITERKRSEEAIRESEERYRTLFNSMDEGYCIIEVDFDAHQKPVDFRYLEVNPAFAIQTGMSDVIGKSIRELAPDLEEYRFETFGKVVLTDEPVRFVNEAKAMGRWFDFYAFRVGGQHSRKVAVLFIDITEAKEVDSDLRATKVALSNEKAALDEHVLQLQQTNENLVHTTLKAHALAEEIEKARERMAHLAQHDALTDLPNRILLGDRLAQAISLAHRHGKQFALMFLDLDRFKEINDSLGHIVGDQLLQSVAKRLTAAVRSSDTVCRLGGDEFVILLSEIEHAQDAMLTAENILTALKASHRIEQFELHVTVSIGISIYPDDGENMDALIKNADAAMYQAKAFGRNNYQFFR